MLEDVQSRGDSRQLPLDEVGISGIRYPAAVLDRESVPVILHALRERLGSRTTFIEVSFPYFLRRQAPVNNDQAFVRVRSQSLLAAPADRDAGGGR